MVDGMRTIERVAAAAFTGMGLLALAAPSVIPRRMGLAILDETGRSEVRAVYGGFGLVVAASLVTGDATARAAARRWAGRALLGMAAGRAADTAITRDVPLPSALAAAGETALGVALLRAH